MTLPSGRFSTAPIVTATAWKTGDRDDAVTGLTRSATAISGQVRASRPVPQAIVSLLVTLTGGYDIFACSATDLTPVDIIATAPVP